MLSPGIRTPIARRALAAHLLSAVLATLLGTTLIYRVVRQRLDTDLHGRLVDDARVYGLEVFSRLLTADRLLAQPRVSKTVKIGADTPHLPR